ncbi:MAG: TonB-dependent receptor plug domain-containing protein [Gemmatimonadaceae bacterium]
MTTRSGARVLMVYTAALAGVIGAGCASAPSSGVAAAPAPAPDSVTVAYGRVSRAHLTDAVSSLGPDDMDKGHALRIEDLIEGRLPGVQVSRSATGQLSIRIRGAASFQTGGSEPLIVIDGMAAPAFGGSSALDSIAPSDVARIDVLKDAGAAAIYGAQGANGVIIVTTKRRTQ